MLHKLVLICLLAIMLHPVTTDYLFSFDHGVASGDPLPTAIILWTRVTPRVTLLSPNKAVDTYGQQYPQSQAMPVNVTWYVCIDPECANIVDQGVAQTDGNQDWTVKVDVGDLQSGVKYYYRFSVDPWVFSAIGTFKLPFPRGQHMQRIRYAVFGCTDFWGYFNAYDMAARYADLDFWMHLGDFFYEYSRGQLAPGRYSRTGFRSVPYTEPLPSKARKTMHFDDMAMSAELLNLNDYRTRYSSYRFDPALQALSAAAPAINIWDDHEYADNAWVNGSRNHSPETDGDWEQRKEAANKAWHEWNPIRSIVDGKFIKYNIYRSFEFGDLATLIMLENRVVAKTDSNPNPYTPIQMHSDGVYSIIGRVSSIIKDVPVEEWKSSGVEQELLELRDELDDYRSRENHTYLGPQQNQWLADQIQSSVDGGVTWVILGLQQVVQDIYLPDWEAAIKQKLCQGDVVTAAQWQQVLDNATTLGASYTFSPTNDFRRMDTGSVKEVTKDEVNYARLNLAASKYRINWSYDGWQGFLLERKRLMEALMPSQGNAIIHASDMHQSYVGTVRNPEGLLLPYPNQKEQEESLGNNKTFPTVASEFTIGTYSSGIEEAFYFTPHEMNNLASTLANTYMTGTDFQGKGLIVATLTHEKLHTDYVFFDTFASMNYNPNCGMAYDYYSSKRLEQWGVDPYDNMVVPSQCYTLPVNGQQPYEYMLKQFGVKVQNPLAMDVRY